ncbi:peptide MFS transporter [Fructilactobacillus fructivorans]|uniref:peptide MFS transporter n=1 Tax=Fructilactobacillus fructivorans TaxID=1614 RepID=UPI00070520E7|nr:peptide MFS transporter [Fructilactobacillus fructivorans]
MDGQGEKSLDHAFFGQPKGLQTLFFTEMWERFSYYGMRAILLYYMYFSVAKGGLGFSPTTAASVMAIYGSLVFLTSVLGGYLSDRVWGSRKTVLYGGILIMFGHVVLSLPFGAGALFISIVLITVGTGLLKPNVSEMVGALYGENDPRRDTGFTIFVFGINLGSFIAPILVGTVGMDFNFHAGFSLAAIGMFFALIYYYFSGKKTLSIDGLYPSDPLEPDDLNRLVLEIIGGLAVFAAIIAGMWYFKVLSIDNFVLLLSIIAILTPIIYFVVILRSKKVTKTEHSRVLAYIPLFIAAAVFWAIEEQGSVVLALFAENQTNNNLGFLHINATWYQSLNPLFIMIYTPLFAFLWTYLTKRKDEPSSPAKFTWGMFFAGLSYLFMIIPIFLFGSSAKVSPLWLIGSWAIVEIAEMLISPIGLSVTTKLAPKAFESQMMSMWFLADAAGQAVNSQIVKFYTPGHEIAYFGIVGLVAIAFGVVLLLMIKPVKKLMDGVN